MITCAMDKGPLIKFYNSGLDLLNWDELACCGKQAKTNRHIWTNHHKRHFALYWLGGMIYFICIYREEPLLSNVTNSDMLSYEYKQSLSLSHEIYRSISKPEDKNTLAYKKNACTWQAYFALIKYIETQYCAYLSLQPCLWLSLLCEASFKYHNEFYSLPFGKKKFCHFLGGDRGGRGEEK